MNQRAEADYFPYVCSPEEGLPRYLRVRAEGIPLSEAIWSGLSYLRKYRRAKWSAPPEEVAYFDRQRQLLRFLTDEPDEGLWLALLGDVMWLRDGWHSFLSPEVLSYL